MDKRLDDWFDDCGRRLAELKITGGDEFFVEGEKDIRKMNNLSGSEWIEFFSLIGQLDGLAWALCPEDDYQAKKFHREIARRMERIENHCRRVLKVAGTLNVIKGKA